MMKLTLLRKNTLFNFISLLVIRDDYLNIRILSLSRIFGTFIVERCCIIIASLSTSWAPCSNTPGGCFLSTYFLLPIVIKYVGFDWPCTNWKEDNSSSSYENSDGFVSCRYDLSDWLSIIMPFEGGWTAESVYISVVIVISERARKKRDFKSLEQQKLENVFAETLISRSLVLQLSALISGSQHDSLKFHGPNKTRKRLEWHPSWTCLFLHLMLLLLITGTVYCVLCREKVAWHILARSRLEQYRFTVYYCQNVQVCSMYH